MANGVAGRPEIKIDRKQFEKLCGLHCTKYEIASFFNVSERKIDKWCHKYYGKCFREVYNEKVAVGNISLRRSQWKLSEKNPTMAIWLGKQYLGQKDNPVQEDSDLKLVKEFLNALRGENVEKEEETEE